MAPNTQPIFSKLSVIGLGPTLSPAILFTTADTSKDGTGATAVKLIFTASGADGNRVDRIRCKALGTNTASVLRVWINNGSIATTATNNGFLDDLSLPATTLSEVARIPEVDIELGIVLSTGYRLYGAIGTTVSAGWHVMVIGGAY
jgi:hypothetical protein